MIGKEYEELFESEAEELLINMEKALLELEKSPKDEESLKEVFRGAHTIKGMAAALNKKEIEILCHKLEDELDRLIKKEKRIENLNYLFEELDKLRELIFSKREEKKKELKSLRFEIYIDPDTPLKGARMFVILKELEKMGNIIESVPSKEDIEKDRDIENVLKVFFTTHLEPEIIQEKIKEISDVEYVFLEKEEIEKKEEIKKDITALPIKEIKIRAEKLDMVFDRLGEIVILKDRLFSKLKKLEDPEIQDTVENFERLIMYLQDDILSMRLVPVFQILDRFPRFVRDKARELEKDVELVIEGGEIELDRVLLEELREPLLHLVRNSIDHGIEKREERVKLGKPPKGKIKIEFIREKSSVTIVVEDDGRGIDREEIVERAVEKGIISPDKALELSEKEIFDILTIPGFSSKRDVSYISGRGIGLDVVKKFVTRLGGNMDIESKRGKGTKIRMRLPISLAIVRSLVVETGGQRFVVPLIFVQETFEKKREDIKTILSREYIVIRKEVLPLIWLSEKLNISNGNKDRFSILVVEINNKKFALGVEKISVQQDIVVKPLDEFLMKLPYVSGGTILWDGKPSLIIDPQNIMER
jgi:two-component system chemotaxis sensor kinase CheA